MALIVDDLGATVATVATDHEGRGVCTLTPQAGRFYVLRIDRPAGVVAPDFPVVQSAGAVLRSMHDRQPASEPVALGLSGSQPGLYRVTVTKEGLPLAAQLVRCEDRTEQVVRLAVPDWVDGVLTATVFDAQGRPLAERLVFRQPAQRLALTVTAGRDRYAPGDTVQVTVTTRDEAGRPVGALVGLTVCDRLPSTLLPRRDLPPDLPAMVLLEQEVREFCDAGAYLGADAVYARRCDLLLGTQGWRRFRPVEKVTAPAGSRLDESHLLPPVEPVPEGVAAVVSPDIPGARDEAVALSETGGQGAFMAIGVGGGAAGMFGWRTGGGRRRAIARYGGTRQSEACVEHSNRWLALHQLPNGSWSAALPVHPAGEVPACTGAGTAVPVRDTGLALLVFVGSGYDHKHMSKWRKAVKGGVEWLRSQQRGEGDFHPETIPHAIATMAMTEIYALSGDPDLRQPAQAALDQLLRRRVPTEGDLRAWASVTAPESGLDAITSTWAVMAVKSGKMAGLETGQALEQARNYLQAAWQAANPKHAEIDLQRGRSTFPATFGVGLRAAHLPHQPEAGLTMAVFLGLRNNDPLLETLANQVLARLPRDPGTHDLGQRYFGGLGLFQVGGGRWQEWNDSVRQTIVDDRNEDPGCGQGSWDPSAKDGFGGTGGRLVASVLSCLPLQTYYHYLPLNSGRPAETTPAYVYVREFAHQRLPHAGDLRQDPLPTLYWNIALATDPATGQATARFQAGDRLGVFHLMADGFDLRGALGATVSQVAVGKALEIACPIPPLLSTRDRLDLPLACRSEGTEAVRYAVSIDGREVGQVAAPADRPATLALGDLTAGTHGLAAAVLQGTLSDRIERPLRVRDIGFPYETGGTPLLKAGREAEYQVDIPARLVPGSLRLDARLVMGAADQFEQSLAAMVGRPSGCFEQTSSTLHPMVLALRLAKTNGSWQQKPDLFKQSREGIAEGVKRLVGYACPGGGFEWFGKDPGHAGLTAYGVLEFSDIASVHPVDDVVIARASTWLLAQRGPDGAWSGRTGLHAWGDDGALTNGYIVWSLLESRRVQADAVAGAIAALRSRPSRASPWLEALAALVAVQAGDRAEADQTLDALTKVLDGPLEKTCRSLTDRNGTAAAQETLALATQAFHRRRADGDADRARVLIERLLSTSTGGYFGSSQATALALRAIDEIGLPVAGSLAGRRWRITCGDAVLLDRVLGEHPTSTDLRVQLPWEPAAGRQTLRTSLTGADEAGVPCSLTIAGSHQILPPAATEAPTLTVALAPAACRRGDPLLLTLEVGNPGREGQDSPMAVVGLPAGLRLDEERLDGLRREDAIAAWELKDGDLVLYWRHWPAGHRQTLRIPAVADLPGRFHGPPSRVLPYYAEPLTRWAEPLVLEVGR